VISGEYFWWICPLCKRREGHISGVLVILIPIFHQNTRNIMEINARKPPVDRNLTFISGNLSTKNEVTRTLEHQKYGNAEKEKVRNKKIRKIFSIYMVTLPDLSCSAFLRSISLIRVLLLALHALALPVRVAMAVQQL